MQVAAIVTIQPTDAGFYSEDCGSWSPPIDFCPGCVRSLRPVGLPESVRGPVQHLIADVPIDGHRERFGSVAEAPRDY